MPWWAHKNIKSILQKSKVLFRLCLKFEWHQMVQIKLVSDHSELEGIKKLQEENLQANVGIHEAAKEGFVSAVYSIEFLKTMHDVSPSVIAKDEEKVVGYALVATKEISDQHDLLAYLFNTIDTLVYKNFSLKDSKYVVVGQLCVAKNYRGKGIVQEMYQYYKKKLQSQYDYCLTDIAQSNPRSLKAHLKTDFKIISTLIFGGVGWDIVIWDWNE